MKTLRQLAAEIGVSKQAVYKRYMGKLFAECQPHVTSEYSKLVFDETAEAIIKKDFIDNPSVDRSRSTEGADTESSIYDELRLENISLRAENLKLRQMLADKDKDIAVLDTQKVSDNRTITDLRADKKDMQRYRDKLTYALMVSKTDIGRMNDAIRLLTSASFKDRVIGWKGFVKQISVNLEGEALLFCGGCDNRGCAVCAVAGKGSERRGYYR